MSELITIERLIKFKLKQKFKNRWNIKPPGDRKGVL